MVILFYSAKILFSLNGNTIFEIFFDPVVPNDSIRPESILGEDVNTVLLVFLDFVHENVWVSRDGLDAALTLADVAQLYLRFISSLDFDSRPIHMRDVAAEDLRLGVHSLQIKSHEGTCEDVAVLNHHTVFSL
jgi:hypothetical protein